MDKLLPLLVVMVFYSWLAPKIKNDNAKLITSALVLTLVSLYSARILNLSLTDLGFTNLLYGSVVGLSASFILSTIIGGASWQKKTKKLFEDLRVVGVSAPAMLRKTLIDIPIATVLFEELLFRGVLLGWFLTMYSDWIAILLSSLLFGLWHIVPSLGFLKTNKTSAKFPIPTIVGTVIFTASAGIIFAWLRVFSGSIIAPIMIHFTSNSASFAASWFTMRNVKK